MDYIKLKNKLESKEYNVSIFDTHQEAVEYLNNNLNNYSIGIGGSMTIKEIGLNEALKTHNTIYWHWDLNDRDRLDVMRSAQTADIYISSLNAISETGELINIDGTCNRVSATLFGHKKVIFVVGKNKIEDSLDKAILRARNVAAPLNAKRLNLDTPCTKLNKCIDCNHSQRICNGMTILFKKPTSCEYEVVIIKENLGY